MLPSPIHFNHLSTLPQPTFMGYQSPSPAIWGKGDDDDLVLKLRNRLNMPFGAGLMSPVSQDEMMRDSQDEDKENEDGEARRQWERAQTMKKLTGVERSLTSSTKARRAVVDGVVRKSLRRDGCLATVDDDRLGSWNSADFVNPRPAPPPPPVGASSLGFRPPPWGGGVFTRPGAYLSAGRGHSTGRTRDLDQSQTSIDLKPFIAVHPTSEAQSPSPRSQQHTPFEPVRPPPVESPPPTVPKQQLGGGTIPLPTVSTSNLLASGRNTRLRTHLRHNSVDSSMDRVYVQIQDCLGATEKMDETLFACAFIRHDSLAETCTALRESLRIMQQTIDEGIPNVELDTPEKKAWNFKHQTLELSVQKNVRKYYQLAIQTALKPPRVNHLDDRMLKLNAYVRKFKDLNLRILTSYDKLRILDLRSQLNTAYASARRSKSEESTHQREWVQRWKTEKQAITELKRDIHVLRGQRSKKLTILNDLKYASPSPIGISL